MCECVWDILISAVKKKKERREQRAERRHERGERKGDGKRREGKRREDEGRTYIIKKRKEKGKEKKEVMCLYLQNFNIWRNKNKKKWKKKNKNKKKNLKRMKEERKKNRQIDCIKILIDWKKNILLSSARTFFYRQQCLPHVCDLFLFFYYFF